MGDTRVGGFGEFLRDVVDGLVVSFYSEGGDLRVCTFSEDVPRRVEAWANGADWWGWWSRSFVSDTVGDFGIVERPIPILHDDGAPGWEDAGVMNVSLGVR